MNVERLICDLNTLIDRLNVQVDQARRKKNFGQVEGYELSIQTLKAAKNVAREASRLPISGVERPSEVDPLVRLILQETLGVDAEETTDSAKIREDLGAESLDILDIRMEVEKQMGVRAKDEELDACTTVIELIFFIRERLKNKLPTNV